MKTAMMILVSLGFLFMVGQAIAADVIVTVTVPDADVDELTAMVEAKYMHPGNSSCTGLTVKTCFTKMCIEEAIKKEYSDWKYAQDMKASTDAVVRKNIEVNAE